MRLQIMNRLTKRDRNRTRAQAVPSARRFGPGPVVFYGSPSPLAASILEIAQLAGVKLTTLDPVENSKAAPTLPQGTALVLVAAGEHFSSDWVKSPQVTVGQAGSSAEILLPQQAHYLMQVLTSTLLQPGNDRAAAGVGHPVRRQTKVIIVAGAHGGAGCTTAVKELSRAGRAIAVDASNHPPAKLPNEDELHWGLINPADPPLPADLLRGLSGAAGFRYLQADMGDAVSVVDPRVETVIGSSPTNTVLDAGVWQPEIEKLAARLLGRGLDPRLLLVGTDGRSEALRMAGILSASSGICFPTLILVAGRETDEIRAVCANWKVDLYRFPAGRRARQTQEWLGLWKKISGE